MKYEPIIKSLLENDLYKFSMGQAIWSQFPSYTTKWEFRCRNKDVVFTQAMIGEIREQINAYCDLRFTEDELDYLRTIKWLKPAYIDFLRLWHPRREDIFVNWTEDGCGLEIWAEGSWLNTSPLEVPILAIVNEVYYREKYGDEYPKLESAFMWRLKEKAEWLKMHDVGAFSEFGLRRRFNGEMQDRAVALLKKYAPTWPGSRFVGTSNVYLAKKHGLTPVGTMAHEFVMSVGQGNPKHNPAYSNWYMMDAWVREYGILNGIALTDTIGTDAFLKDFQLTFATLFSGVRHDSGDPFAWGEKMLRHYEGLGIDPKTKTLLFSDSLDFERAAKIYDAFKDRAKVAFGIGTYLANDTGVEPLNIVMKVTECNGLPAAKLSDVDGKTVTTNTEYVEYLRRTIRWRMEHGR